MLCCRMTSGWPSQHGALHEQRGLHQYAAWLHGEEWLALFMWLTLVIPRFWEVPTWAHGTAVWSEVIEPLNKLRCRVTTLVHASGRFGASRQGGKLYAPHRGRFWWVAFVRTPLGSHDSCVYFLKISRQCD